MKHVFVEIIILCSLIQLGCLRVPLNKHEFHRINSIKAESTASDIVFLLKLNRLKRNVKGFDTLDVIFQSFKDMHCKGTLHENISTNYYITYDCYNFMVFLGHTTNWDKSNFVDKKLTNPDIKDYFIVYAWPTGINMGDSSILIDSNGYTWHLLPSYTTPLKWENVIKDNNTNGVLDDLDCLMAR